MADTHEERVLTNLLRTIAAEDASLVSTRTCEQQLLERWTDARAAARHSSAPERVATRWTIGAGILAAILIASLAPRLERQIAPVAQRAGSAEQQAVSDQQAVRPARGSSLERARLEPAGVERASARRATRRPVSSHDLHHTLEAAVAAPPAPIVSGSQTEVADFIPLTPLVSAESLRSFQIVRVQMPRSSLGALTRQLDMSDLVRANDPVQADLLLGEDGLARAIRVAPDRTPYPWRTR